MKETYSFRLEQDALGKAEIKKNVLWGIATQRAINNFGISKYQTNKTFIKAMGFVKLACAKANFELGFIDANVFNAIEESCLEIIENKHDTAFVVDVFQGGAGTSTNMNFNEVIANLANVKLGRKLGEYNPVSPLNTVNMHQSTNDVYPTAVKTACLFLLKDLEVQQSFLQEELQKKEQEFGSIVKLGRTQLQDAVPITLGMEFGSYSDALARDRWRIFKCRERIKTVNLGGTAIGTGLGAPRKYIFKAAQNLRKLTGLNISRNENLVDATQNLDSFVEVSGMLKAYAVNLYKIANDLRLMASGPAGGLNEIELPKLQAGSSIMPSKVNPVISEAISQVALKVMNNDSLIGHISALGQLELNHMLPLLNFSLLESLGLLTSSTKMFYTKCISGIKAKPENCLKKLYNSPMVATVLVPYFGYAKVEELIKKAEQEDLNIFEAAEKHLNVSKKKLTEILKPEKMYKLGFDHEKDRLD